MRCEVKISRNSIQLSKKKKRKKNEKKAKKR